jgi:hypothetical protein
LIALFLLPALYVYGAVTRARIELPAREQALAESALAPKINMPYAEALVVKTEIDRLDGNSEQLENDRKRLEAAYRDYWNREAKACAQDAQRLTSEARELPNVILKEEFSAPKIIDRITDELK